MASPSRRRRFPALTPLRAERLRQALTIAEVASESGISSFRVSIIERDPDQATPEELGLLRQAIGRLTGKSA
jgi:hypothetical protein